MLEKHIHIHVLIDLYNLPWGLWAIFIITHFYKKNEGSEGSSAKLLGQNY